MSTWWKASCGVCIIAVALFAAESPFVGTWKQNAAKSKMEGSGLGANAMIRIEPEGAALKISVETTLQGQPNNYTYQATLDDKFVKVTGNPAFDEILTQRINDHTISARGRKAGTIVFTDRRVVASDGKSMTISRFGTNPEGKPFKATIVFDKQ